MPDVIVCADARWVIDEVTAVFGGPDDHVRAINAGDQVLPAVRAAKPDLAILDMQIGSMGAMATAMELRLEESGGRIGHVPVLFLLDRRADVFLARRSEVDGWVIKPLDPIRLSNAVHAILAGGRYEDASYRPLTVAGLVATGPEHD